MTILSHYKTLPATDNHGLAIDIPYLTLTPHKTMLDFIKHHTAKVEKRGTTVKIILGVGCL